MKKHLGIFYFDTNTHLQKQINKHNYTLLKDQFDMVVIVDIFSEYSISLKNELNLQSHYIVKNVTYKKIDIQLYVYQQIEYEKYDYITWIDNSNIFIHNLTSYLNYMSEHQYYTYIDAFEGEVYTYNMSIYSLHSSCIGQYICFLKRIRNTYTNENRMWDAIQKEMLELFPSRIPFLKFGYNELLFDKNIFLDMDEFYQKLIESNVISYISIISLIRRRELFKNNVYETIPSHFDLDVYKRHEDLSKLETDEMYYQHYLKHGQFEMRKCSEEMEYILPHFLRKQLIKYNFIHYFDIQSHFNLLEYKNSLKHIEFKNTKDYIVHWLESGIYQGKKY